MSATVNDNMVWHNDGHAMHLRLDKSDLSIIEVDCPGSGECLHEQIGCLVRFFLTRFGLECNVGIAEPASRMEVAWTLVGDTYDIDTCQVWVIPKNDEAFAAWLMTYEA